MKIVMVMDNFAFQPLGGIGRVMLEEGKRLVTRGHETFLVTKRINETLPLESTVDGIQIFSFDVSAKNYPRYLFQMVVNIRALCKKIRRHGGIELFLVHQPLGALGIPQKRKSKVPTVYMFHSSWPHEYQAKIRGEKVLTCGSKLDIVSRFHFGLRKQIELLAIRRCDAVIVLSDYSKKVLAKTHGLKNIKKSVRIPGGVDLQKFHLTKDRKGLRQRLGFSSSQTVFLTVRRLVSRMGLEELIQAFSILGPKAHNAFLLIGGEGNLRAPLEKKVVELGLTEKVRFEGFLEDARLPEYYQAADCFVLPSREQEGFGLVTLEAMACGTPVYGTPIGGTVEILGQFDRSHLFTTISPEAIARGMLNFVQLSPEKRVNLRKRCRAFVEENYTWGQAVDRLEVLFESLVP